MTYKVFYAWQSDQDGRACRFLIRDAAKLALKKLNADAKLTSAPAFELDHDTKGVAGHPHIASVIRRKIKECSVFIADVTHVAKYTTADGREKHAQNPNVLIELGIAVRAKGFERLLLVMNDHFGPVTELPFDLKSHSFPITYTLSDADAADKGIVKAATEELAKVIAAKLKPMLGELAEADAGRSRLTAAAEEAAGRQRAEETWKKFDDRFGRGDFRGIAEHSVLTVIGGNEPVPTRDAYIYFSIIPLRPLPQPLDVGEIAQKNPHGLQPMGSSGWNTELFGRALVFHDGLGGRGNRRAEPPNSVTELTDDGCIFAATSMGVGSRQDGASVIMLEAPEYQMLRHLPAYVRVLREVGVKGPVEVRVTLTGTSGVFIHPARPINWDTRTFRKLSEGTITLDPVTITEDMDDGAVAAAMRPAFTLVWREAGLPHDPCFDATGNLRVL